MRKLILAFMLVISYCVCFAQKDKEPLATPYAVPIDTITKLIAYEGVIEVKGMAAADLYKRIDDWFHIYFKNPKDVIRENDSIKFSIVGKPRVRISDPPNKDGLKTDGGMFQVTITVGARDGRFKYELTNFNWVNTSYYPCERWLDTKAPSYAPAFNDYLQQLDTYSLETIKSLKEAVTKEKPVKDKDKW